MSAASYIGGCLCGSVRYEVMGGATKLCFCHCSSCRRAVGAPMVPWGTVLRERFTIAQGRFAEYRSFPQVTRGFCAACGTSLTYCHEKRANEIDLALATLDDPSVLVPDAHIWVQDKLPCVIIADGRPRFDTVRINHA